MTSETRRVRRELALGVVLVFATLLAASMLAPRLASAREAGSAATGADKAVRIVTSPSRVANGSLRGGFFGRHGLLGSTAVDTTAELTGTTADEVRAALEDGQTLAEYAEANGVTETALVEAIVAAETARIDQAVADGTLDQERADELKAGLTERVTEKVNRTGGPGGCPGRDGEETEDTETQST